jgi:ribonuclease P protein component
MLRRAHRLRRTRDIERVRAIGRSAGTKPLHVRFAPTGRSVSRATVVVSNRTAKSAVVRNRAKRQVRAALTPLLSSIHPAHDLLIVVHRAALDLTTAELQATLAGALRRITRRPTR